MRKHKKKKEEPTSEKPELGTVVERKKDRIVIEHKWREEIPIRPTPDHDVVCDDDGATSTEDDEKTNDVFENEGDHESPEDEEEVYEED